MAQPRKPLLPALLKCGLTLLLGDVLALNCPCDGGLPPYGTTPSAVAAIALASKNQAR